MTNQTVIFTSDVEDGWQGVKKEDPRIQFLDPLKRTVFIPQNNCSTIELAKEWITQNYSIDDIEFWSEGLLFADNWNQGITSEHPILFYQSPFVAETRASLHRSCPPPPPSTRTSSVQSLTVTLLPSLDDIFKANGDYRLPDCDDRVFRFRPFNDSNVYLNFLQMHTSIRVRTPPKRWADLRGNSVNIGKPTGFKSPIISLGPAFSDGISQSLGSGFCVVILAAKLTKLFSNKEEIGCHLDGDDIYQWVRYPSVEYAKECLHEKLSSGFSVMGSWMEVPWNKNMEDQFVGMKIATHSCEYGQEEWFAVVGEKDMGQNKD